MVGSKVAQRRRTLHRHYRHCDSIEEQAMAGPSTIYFSVVPVSPSSRLHLALLGLTMARQRFSIYLEFANESKISLSQVPRMM
jgi:hypothetical protein